MKKIFTIAAAILASAAMMAADFEPTAVYKVGDQTTLGPQWKTGQNNNVDYFESGDTVIFSPYLLYQSAATGYQEWTGCAGSGSTGTTWDAQGCFKGSTAWYKSSAKAATTRSTRQYFYNVTNCSEVSILIKSGSSLTAILSAYEINAGVIDSASVVSNTYKSGSNGILTVTGLDMTKTYRIVVNADKDSNCSFYEIAFVGKASTDPVLAVNPEEVTLNVTAAVANPSAKVVFSGKNLAAGNYALTVPNVAGLTVAPTSVTVGEDGKLDTEVTISYTSAVDVAAASVNITLTVGELNKTVAVNYSAALAKVYLKSNVNIEQLVLDNGKGYDIKAALTAAGWEYENLNDLDSLNDSKDKRNEPYLGLKIKKQGGYVAGWLKNDGLLLVKFGNIGDPIKVTIKGANTNVENTFTNAQLAEQGNVLPVYGYTEDVYVKIETTTANTVVLKQLMLDEIAEVILPDSPTTAIENTDAAVKAVKVVRNGQMFIQKNGVLYNMQGAVVK